MRIRLATSSALILSLAVGSSAQLKRYDPEWNRPATPHRVIGPIYFVGTNALASFLITTRDGHLLLDPGYEESVPLVKSSIRALGFRYEDVKVLLNSQAHFDHAAGIALIKRETGARLEVMAEDASLLASGGKDDFVLGPEYMFPPVKADRLLKDGDVITLGDVRLVARHTPGHTKGATTFVTTAIDGGQAYPVVFATSTTVNAGTRLVGNARYPGIVSDWERTYAILDSLAAGVWVSAHTNVFDMEGKRARIGTGGNPYIDPTGYRRYVESSRQRFVALLAAELAAN